MKRLFLFLVLFLGLSVSSLAFAPRQIIVVQVSTTQTNITVQFVMWVVPSSADPHPGFVSATTTTPNPPSVAEASALASGTVVELPLTEVFPSGTAVASIKAQLQADFTAAQAKATATSVINRAAFSGCAFDGTTWGC